MGLFTLIGISIMAEHVGKSIVETGKKEDMKRAQMEAYSREKCTRMMTEAEIEKTRINATANVINNAMRNGYQMNPGIMGSQFVGSYRNRNMNQNDSIITSIPPTFSGSYTEGQGHIRDIDCYQGMGYNQYSGYDQGSWNSNGYQPVYAIEGRAPAKKFCPNCGCRRDSSQSFCENCGMKFN